VKRKIRCIYIDGIEKSGKTSVTREIRKFLKEKNKDLCEIYGIKHYQDHLNMQDKILNDNNNSFVLKEGSLMQVFYDYVKRDFGPSTLEKDFSSLVRKEKEINHNFGAAHFFLIPEDEFALDRVFKEKKPHYIMNILNFYKNINLYTLTQGLDIRLIFFNEHDKIYDVRDKILKLLKNNYEI
jgi:hypothetical protein